MPFVGLSSVIWVLCAVHIVRTGRPYYWIMIVGVPVIGPLAYFLSEMLPELRNDPGTRRTINTVVRKIDPERERRRIAERLAVADTPKNRLALARECMALGDYANASDLFNSCLSGVFHNDAKIMHELAQARFALGDYANTRQILDDLIAAHPDYRSYDGHLLFARTLAALGQNEEALIEFRSVVEGYPGEQARVAYAQFLEKLGRTAEARVVYSDSLRRAKHAPGYYRREQKEWLDLARQALDGRSANS